MRRRNVMDSPLGGSLSGAAEEDLDPMASMANLADCMLVFACGLILALVLFWNVDISQNLNEVVASEELSELEGDIEEGQAALSSSGQGYEELGVVYVDPETGKMYMLKNAEE